MSTSPNSQPKTNLPLALQQKRSRFVQDGLGMILYSALVGSIVALLAGLYEMSFYTLADFWHNNNMILTDVPTWVRYGAGTLIACPIIYFIVNKIPEKRQHNPADLIAGIHINNGKIDAQSSLLSTLGSVFSIGFGFSVGYYGPTVQLGAGAGFLLHRFKSISPHHYYISIGAGAAAAIAAIFHSPIGAVVFVHEVLFRFFSIRAFAPITIAAVVSYIVSSEFFDKSIFFSISAHYSPTTLTYLIAAVAAFFAALIGMLMIQGIMKLQAFNKKSSRGMMQQLLIAACLTTLVISIIPQAAGSSLTAMQDVILGNQFSLLTLLLIFIAKLLATTIAFGFGVPGGFLGPTIFLGAALGGLLSGSLAMFFPQLVDAQQIIIITTMAAMISSVIGAPIAMILIIVEMTGEFEIISVVMLAVVIANVTAYRFMGCSSLFDIQLKSRGFDFEVSKEQLYAENHSISEIISDDFLTISTQADILMAEKLMLEQQKDIAFVIDDSGNLIGKLNIVDIRYYRREVTIDDEQPVTVMAVTKTSPAIIYRATSIWHALQMMTENNANTIPVVDGQNNPKLLGVIHNNQLIAQYLSFIHQLQNQKNAKE